jgi:hypothetical protein
VVRQADGPYEGGIGEDSCEAVFGQEGYAEAVERLAGVVEHYGKRVDVNQLTSGGCQQRWSHFVARVGSCSVYFGPVLRPVGQGTHGARIRS